MGSALAERQKARALTTQSEKTTLILDGMRDGYYEVNLKGRFTFVNEALARSWGRSREEMLGKSYRDFLEADSIDRVLPFSTRSSEPARPGWVSRPRSGTSGAQGT